jgi:hypothetical protein
MISVGSNVLRPLLEAGSLDLLDEERRHVAAVVDHFSSSSAKDNKQTEFTIWTRWCFDHNVGLPGRCRHLCYWLW